MEKQKITKIVLGEGMYDELEFIIGKNRICEYCKVKITKDNFGYITTDKAVCHSLICLAELAIDSED